MTANPEDTITVGAAYDAMYEFLVRFYETYNSDDVATLLSGLSTLSDGQPMDAAYWTEWIECVQKAQSGEVNTDVRMRK